MTHVQLSNHQEGLSNMLSPEAKEFVPRQFSDGASQSSQIADGLLGASPTGIVLDDKGLSQQAPVNGLPSYMTTCYPFVNSGEQRFGGVRPRFKGKYMQQQQQAMYMTQHFPQIQPGMPGNRFPHPTKGFVSTSAWGPTAMGDMFQNYGNLPNGMPFDGGTYQNGYIHNPLGQMPGQDGKGALSPGLGYSGDNYIDTPPLINGYIDPSKQPWKTKHKQDDKSAKSDSTKKVCFKSSSVQTDFPEFIANATLEESPNTLFNSGQVAYKEHHTLGNRRSRHSSNRNAADPEDINLLHRHNTVSNGTNPTTQGIDVAMLILNNGIDHFSNSVSSNAYSVSSGAFLNSETRLECSSDNLNAMQMAVPYLNESNAVNSSFRRSYASIAQSQPSQNNRQKLVAVATTKSDQVNCDNSVTINRTSTKKNSKSNNKPASRIGNVNVNVAEIMQDLERADKLSDAQAKQENAYQSSVQSESFGKNLYSSAVKEQPKMDNTKSNVPLLSQVLQKKSDSEMNGQNIQGYQIKSQQAGLMKTQVKGYSQMSGNSQYSGSHLVHGKGHQMPSNAQSQVKGQQVQSDNNKSDLDLEKKGQSQSDNNNQGEEGEVKKKKRRRRRRKKKSGAATAEDDADNAGANEEIMLHFEDEEEFPDLSGVTSGDATKSSLFNTTTVSYSDILTNNNSVQSTKPFSQDEMCLSDTTGALPVKESRSSRKRRKRREVANKAADAEMAEINLEQHMLELKMKQKLPLTAKKSVSPVRNTPSQGVWKLTPSSPTSQPSSTGKKVSLLLPGTVAPEPSHNAPHQPNTSAVKQPGILKTPHAQAPPTSGKKSKQPITYDLGALIDALESKKEQPPPKKEKEAKRVGIKKDEVKALNALDSNAPTVKRGKERETPKIKKPSPLKKVILKEREEKKRLRLLDEDEVASGAPVGIGVVSGGESDLSQDASFKGSMDVGLGTPASAELSPISQQSPSCMSPMSPGASPLSSGVNSPITGTIQQTVKLKIHSRRFREYCNQVLDKEIDNHVTALLQDLVRFQDKQYHKDPVKAKAKRRFVLGLREVTKHLKLKKIKCVVISPNLEKIQSKGGLDDALNLILELCNDQKVPFIFALGRRALGRACAKLVPVSVVGIFNYEGSEENFKALVNLTEKARDAYKEMIMQIEKEMAEHPPRACVPGVPHIYAHMGHSRTPSGCSVISFTSSILSEPISENYPHSEPETDNRGYEIEKEDDADDDNDYNEGGKDPYEADDERGYHTTKKAKNIYKEIDPQGEPSLNTDIDNSRESTDVNGNKCEDKEKVDDNKENVVDVSVVKIDKSEIACEDDDFSDDADDYEEDEDENEEKCIDGGAEGNDEDDDSDNESDFESCDNDSLNGETDEEVGDTVEALPTFIDSVHHFDLNEILSQHSSKTLENGEDVMSTHSSKTTHSSRTLGDSSGLAGANDKTSKKIDMKNIDKTGSLAVKSKSGVDKDLKERRTRSWVKEAQNFNFKDQVEAPGETEENVVDVKNVAIECLDAVA